MPLTRRTFTVALAATAASVLTPWSAAAAAPQPQQPSYEKSVAVRVLKGVFERGDTAVVDRFVRRDYIQHNPTAPRP